MGLQKNKFSRFMKERGYSQLKEKRLDQSNSNTLFVGASIMSHMNLLNETTDFKYVTEQRVFNSKRLDDIGNYPLATPFEVMLTIFRYEEKAFSKALTDIVQFLCDEIHINGNKIIFLAPNTSSINDDIQNIGINKKMVVHWKKDLPLFLNDKNKGKYVKLFYPYHNGLMPIGTLGIIKKNNKEFIDSALFLERLSFMKEDKNNWFETDYFKETMNYFSKSMTPYLARRTSVYLRTILILYYDRIYMSNNDKGYVVKKMMRSMFSNTDLSSLSDKCIKNGIVSASLDLNKLGYLIDTNVIERLILDLNLEKEKYARSQAVAIKKLNKLNNKRKITNKDLLRLHDEQGLSITEMEKWAQKKAVLIDTRVFKKKPKYWLRNELYKFSNNSNNKTPQELLKEAGEKRL